MLLAILIGQHPFLAENDLVFPILSTLLSFHPFLVILYSLPVSYSNRPARTTRCFTHVALRLTTKNQRPTNKYTSPDHKKNKLQSDVFRVIIDSRQCCQLSQNTRQIHQLHHHHHHHQARIHHHSSANSNHTPQRHQPVFATIRDDAFSSSWLRPYACSESLWGARAVWGDRKKSRCVSWTTSELSASTPTSGRLQPRTRGNGAGRRNKGRNVSWRNESLQRTPELDYGTYSSMPERDQEDSPKQAGACWFVRHS